MSRHDVDEWFWQVGIDMQRLGDETIRTRPTIAPGRCWEPRVDLVEEDERYVLKADIAGVRADDINILYLPDRHSVVLRGIRPETDFASEGHVTVHQLEILYGGFQREIRLPGAPIDVDRMRAQYRNGFLIVVIPKAQEAPTLQALRLEWQK